MQLSSGKTPQSLKSSLARINGALRPQYLGDERGRKVWLSLVSSGHDIKRREVKTGVAASTRLNGGTCYSGGGGLDENAGCSEPSSWALNFYFRILNMQCGSSCWHIADQAQGFVHLHLMEGLCNPRLSAACTPSDQSKWPVSRPPHPVILCYTE